MTPTETPQDKPKQDVALKGRIVPLMRVMALWVFSGATFLVICVGLLFFLVSGQTLRAPDWARDRVESYISSNLVRFQVELGSVVIALSEDWIPSLELIGVAFTDAEDQFIFSLEQVKIGFTLSTMLTGEIKPTYIDSSQVAVDFNQVIKRGSSFALTMQSGQEWKINNIQQLRKNVDDLLALEQLSSLETINIQGLKLSHENEEPKPGWSLQNASLQLSRDAGDLNIIGYIPILREQNPILAIEASILLRTGSASADFELSSKDILVGEFADVHPDLSSLKSLRAPLSGTLRGNMNENGEFTNIGAELMLGPGFFQSAEETQIMRFERIDAHGVLDLQQQFIRINEVNVVSDSFMGKLSGDVSQIETIDGFVKSLAGQFQFEEVTIFHQSFPNQAIVLDQALADFKVTINPFSLKLGQVVFFEQGTSWQISGEMKQEAGGWYVNLDGSSDEVELKVAKALWPRNLLPNSRAWVIKNFQQGMLSDVNFAIRLSPAHPPNFFVGFEFQDVDIQFLPKIPAIRSADGHVSFVGNRLSITATSGRIIAKQGGAINIAGTSFTVPDTSLGIDARAVVRAHGRGNLIAVLSILNEKPIEVFKHSDLSVSSISGLAYFAGEIQLPLLPKVQFNQIDFDISGYVSEVKSNELVPNKLFSASRLRINATNSIIEVTGSGTLADVPFQGTWRKQLGKGNFGSQVTGILELSEATFHSFGVNIPAGIIDGSGNADFSVSLESGKVPNLMLSSNLVGVGLTFSDLNWSKPVDVEGQFELVAQLNESIVVEELLLVASDFSSSLKIDSLTSDTGIVAEFDHIRIEDWLDISAILKVGGDQYPELTVLGGRIDLQKVPINEPEQQQFNVFSRVQLVVDKLDQLQVTKQVTINDFSGQFNGNDGFSGQLRGLVGGEALIVGQIVRKDGQRVIQIQSQDAGGVLRAAKLLPSSSGGSLDLRLRSTTSARDFVGRISVKDISVRDAPVIVVLLNAISVVGLFSELLGQGVVFSDVEARFELSPTELTLLESRAIGPSIGLTMVGTYSLLGKSLDVHGVITPVYLLNQIGGLFSPREGEGLFGLNYRLNGAVDSPEVSVNFLSGLAPGFLRELFRFGGATGN
ncbi:MAG: DUF3971 domain-containing protein [Aestuariivita sp.]|nr:DUF3971 domain-containing protein [Aestuariivita sp.]